MMARHFLGIAKDARGRIAPVFAAPDVTLDALGHHKAVVNALRQGPFLPAAFGSNAADNPDLLAGRLLAFRSRLKSELEHSVDTVEVGVTISLSDVPVDCSAHSSGRAFLQAASSRSMANTASLSLARSMITQATGMAGVRDHRILHESSTEIRVAFAVSRCAAIELVGVLEGAASERLSIEVSGPWPLYSFGLRDILQGDAA
jgi:hypothetical protein